MGNKCKWYVFISYKSYFAYLKFICIGKLEIKLG
jgi:hypothetical protein